MQLIGLTGGIGSGKSMVAGVFRTLGIPVYESDPRAKYLMNHDPEIRKKVIQLFGEESYGTNDELNRSWIAAQAFSDSTLLERLNEIVHPAVFRDLIDWTRQSTQASAPYLIQESAILFEENLTDRLHAIVLVVAPEELRIERVMKRDNVTRDQVLQRINAQWPDDKKIILSDYIVYNDGNRSLIEQVMDIDRMITSLSQTT